MKTSMKVVLGGVAGISALVGVIFWLTGDLTKAGDDFFAAVQNEDIDGAYALLSDDFKAGTSKEDLQTYLAANAFDKIKDTSWGGRMMTGGVAELEGTITTEGGSKIPIKLRLIDSENGWRINAIEKESAGFKDSGGGSAVVPPVGKQQQLFRDTITVYAESLADRSMQKLWDNSSGIFRRQFTVEQLNEAYGRNYRFAGDYAEISKMTPIIDDARIDEGGFFVIKGHYPIVPKPLYVRQSFAYEGVGWVSSGLVLQVGQPPE